jgi:hypothetical protein
MKKSTFQQIHGIAAFVKPLFLVQLALQALDLHSTIAQISTRGEMNKAIVAIGSLTGLIPAVVLMKILSVGAVWMLYTQWQKLPKGSVFDLPVVAVFVLLDITLTPIILNNYWG